MKRHPPDKPGSEPLAHFEPSRPTLWASLVFALATLTLAWPGLLGQTLFNTRSDQYTLGYAFRHFAEVSLRNGDGFPQWSPYLQGGLPYISAMHGDIFYPTFLLRMMMGTAAAITWEFPLHLFLAGLFTYFFLRAWRLPFIACVVGGLAYMLSGSIAGYASPGHDGKLFVSALYPAALHLLTRGIRDGRLSAWGLLAFVIGLAVLSPHPQLLQYLLLSSGFYALYLAFSGNDSGVKLPTPIAVRRVAYAAGGVALGLAIGAIQFIPSFAYKPYSPRAAGHDYETATSFSFPIEETLNAYLPQFSGILTNYWGQNQIHFHSDYFGVVVLILMGAAFGAGPLKSFKRFWIATGVVALLWAYGGKTPLYHLFILVPYTKYLRAPSTIIYITAFAVAVLAALGTERVLSGRISRKYGPAWAIAGGVLALLMTVGGYRILVSIAIGIAQLGFPAEVRSQVADMMSSRSENNATDAMLGAWRSFLFVALTVGVLWAYARQRLTARLAGFALAALVTIDLWSIERLYWQYMGPGAQVFATDNAIEAIRKDIETSGEPGRTMLIPVTEQVARSDAYFRKRALMNHLLRTVEGEQGNELESYRRLVEANSGNARFSPAFWRHENVRYIYTDADEATLGQVATQLGGFAFTKLAGPAPNANGSTVYAYRINMPNPYATVASAAVKAQPEQVMPTVLDERYDPRIAAIVDTGSTIPVRDAAQLAASPLTAQVKSYAPGRVSVQLSAAATEGSVLILSENWYPGWSAQIGNTTVPASRVNFNLLGVSLPAGTREVAFSFADAAYAKGKVVTFAAVVVAGLLLIAGFVWDRRSRNAAEPVAA